MPSPALTHPTLAHDRDAPKTVNFAPAAIHSRWPTHDEDEIAAVADVLRSGRVNALCHGDRCRSFEQSFAVMCAMPHALSVSNGTVALELALRVLGIGTGDEVIVTARSFVASASCVITCGAKPVFADVDPVSQCLTAQSIAAALTPRTRAIIVVHLGGFPAAMDEIMVLAEAYGLKVIEDCAQAHGARFHGQPVGSFGDVAAFSFCTDKIMSTGGEGGMLVLRTRAQWEKAWSLSNHGKDFAKAHLPGGGAFRWIHDDFGSNCRMTEMQAAIGSIQLAKLPRWTATRRRNAGILLETLSDLPNLRLVPPPGESDHAYYAFYAFTPPDQPHNSAFRDRIVARMNDAGMPCQSGSCPEIYREQAFLAGGHAPKRSLPIARQLGQTSIKLPVDQTLAPREMQEIGRTLAGILKAECE